MSLRKLLTSFHFQRGKVSESTSLRDWLLGTGVAAACLAPIGAASSLSGGIVPVGCSGSAQQLCTNGAGQVCNYTDNNGLAMKDACVVSGGSNGVVQPGNLLCPLGCTVDGSSRGSGAQCSINNTCYY
jgi:hypothetical protein